MINEKLFHSIIRRMLRNKVSNVTWIVRDTCDINRVVRMFEGSSSDYTYSASQRTLRFAGITIRFFLDTDDGDRLMGALIDEAIIDEA